MRFRKIISLMISAVCLCSLLNTTAYADDSDNKIKIMAIGDSITDGYGTDGSYRKFLFNELSQSGYDIDMVGPNCSWGNASYTDETTGESFEYDPAHCGYSGYAIEEYSGRNGILETLKSGDYLAEYTPDIVILQIGTNDIIDNHEIETAGERLDTLVSYILENISSESALFVTSVPDLDPNREDVYQWFGNYRHSPDWQTSYSDEEAEELVQQQIDSYNRQVEEVVMEKQLNGVRNIYFRDVNSAITDVSVQLKDGVHPNNDGYRLMGDYWSEVILGYFLEKVTETGLKGDVNRDGDISAADVVLLQEYLVGLQTLPEKNTYNADTDSNNVIDIFDLVLLRRDVIGMNLYK